MLLGLDSYSYHLAFGRHEDFRPTKPINIFDFINKVSDLRLAGLQIDPMHLTSNDTIFLQKIRQKADSKNLFIEYGVASVHRDVIEEGVRICNILDSPILRTFIGYDRYSSAIDLRDKIDLAVKEIRASLKILEKGNVKLAIENHGDVNSFELVKIIEEINHPNVGICLDVGNSLCTLENPLEALERMAPFAVTTHFKDYTVKMTNYGCKIVGVELGQGVLPLEIMLDIIEQESGLDRLILEIPIEAEKDEQETLRKEERAVANSVVYCREVLEVGT